MRAFSFLQRHYRAVELASGGLLLLIGLLIATQQWERVSHLLLRLTS